MDERAQRAKVIELFEKHRATPGAPYDEQHFLDYLVPNPKKKREAYDSIRGLRRFNAFIYEVQMEFAICFSTKDRAANYSLPKFVDRVVELERSRRGSLMSLKYQERAGPGWQVLVVANFVLVIVGCVLRRSGPGLVIVAGAAILVNALFVRFARSEKAYQERLRARIEESATLAGSQSRSRHAHEAPGS